VIRARQPIGSDAAWRPLAAGPPELDSEAARRVAGPVRAMMARFVPKPGH
jgi:hypothetical protein